MINIPLPKKKTPLNSLLSVLVLPQPFAKYDYAEIYGSSEPSNILLICPRGSTRIPSSWKRQLTPPDYWLESTHHMSDLRAAHFTKELCTRFMQQPLKLIFLE
eukprot:UN01439